MGEGAMTENNYEQFRITTGKQLFCIKCGAKAEYENYGYTWCEAHKEFVHDDPEELEDMVIERLDQLGDD